MRALEKYTEILNKIKDSGLTIKQYCINNGISYNSLYVYVNSLKGKTDEETINFLQLYDSIAQYNSKKVEQVDTDDRADIAYVRDEEGKIQYYSYEIYKKNKSPLIGKLSRDEMNTIYRLYSYYGDSLTQRVVSRYFVEFSLIDFKRILRAFNITKASAPFAPHMFEEKSEEELREMQLREKENSFLRRAEEDAIKNNEKLLRKYAQENIELKKQLNNFSSFEIILPEIEPYNFKKVNKDSNTSINLYLSDLHLGSYTTSGSIYDENRNYGFEEAKRRLSVIIEKLYAFKLNTINVVLMGDMVDCAGFTGYTASLTHQMPNNMDAREQGNKYIELMVWFIDSIARLCYNLNVYSVPAGNHDGNYGYILNKALMYYINSKYPQIKTELWEKYYGRFEQDGHVFYIMHGKHFEFMKKGMPLVLDPKTQNLLYEWIMEQKDTSDNIHFIKGDLHSNALSSCKKFDYRNVLSLYGSSDYSNLNFSRNSYGVSYDMITYGELVRGTFENI